MRQTIVFLLMVLVVAVAFSAPPVQAQAPLRLTSAEMALWPEYDRPGVLVIYRLVVAESVPMPAALVVSLPAAAGVPNAVAERVGNGLMSLAYERAVSGDVAQLRFVANSRTLQVEYYDPGISRDGTRRSFEHRWTGDYAVAALSAVVQHPVGSRNLSVDPAAAPAQVGNDSLTYQRVEFGALDAGDQRVVRVQYDKDDDVLSASVLPPQAATPPAATPPRASETAGELAPGRATSTRVFEALLVLGLAGLVLGLLLRRRVRRRTGAAGAVSAYCTRCGRPAARDDRFCGKCGASLRGK